MCAGVWGNACPFPTPLIINKLPIVVPHPLATALSSPSPNFLNPGTKQGSDSLFLEGSGIGDNHISQIVEVGI